MKKSFKTIASLVLAFSMVFVMLFVTSCGGNNNGGGTTDPEAGRNEFIAEIGGVSETFAGSVSDNNYPSSVAAATGYLLSEVNIKGVKISTNKESKGFLEGAALTALNIPSNILENSKGVEAIEVTYDVYESAANPNPISTGNKVTVYTISYDEEEWEYFIPCPNVGDYLSSDYLSSVFNSPKYQNCTFTSSMTAYMKAESYGMTYEGTVTLTQTSKFANGKLYVEIESSSTLPNAQEGTTKTYSYVELNGTDLVCYIKENETDAWKQVDVSPSALAALNPFADYNSEPDYFVKTEYGFKVNPNYVGEYLFDAFNDVVMGAKLTNDGVNMYAEYYVSEGALSGVRIDALVDTSIDGVNYYFDIDATASCTNYGTTVVEKPFAE